MQRGCAVRRGCRSCLGALCRRSTALRISCRSTRTRSLWRGPSLQKSSSSHSFLFLRSRHAHHNHCSFGALAARLYADVSGWSPSFNRETMILLSLYMGIYITMLLLPFPRQSYLQASASGKGALPRNRSLSARKRRTDTAEKNNHKKTRGAAGASNGTAPPKKRTAPC